MLRAGSGQLGTASTGPLPPDISTLPRLNAIASSSGSFAGNLPPIGSVCVSELVAIVSAAGAASGRAIVTVRVARSQRSEIAKPNDAIDPPAVGI